ncbi:MAG TPA: calcium-translocating P-type ATPase, PMCA-type [Syntrophales bacterium]|nr:calcium-translocating P-type ATPase, PMCA-type [Syntrophales bacterium]
MIWHQQDIKAVLAELDVPIDGLRSEEAGNRLAKYGRNELVEKGKRSPAAMIVDQFRDFMIIVLIAAAVVSGFLGEVADTVAILCIVLLNAVIGVVQEYRAEKAMEALKEMAAPMVRVLRDGKVSAVPGAEIVPGDLVLLEAGAIVPADMRLVEAVQLRVEEAALTGESVPVEKHTRALREELLPLGDRSNMVFKGTVVTYGRGTGVVVGTGMETELGKIASMLQEEEEVKTPLQRRLTVFGKKIAAAVLIICAFIFGVGLLRGEAPVLMFLTAVSLAVAAIPEALPAVITISLALGARKMADHNALIRKLPAVETLGSVTYICSDKTGTLTLNRMTVEELYVNGKLYKTDNPEIKHFDQLMKALALSNDARPYRHQDIVGVTGDPTEIALYRIAQELGFVKAELEKGHPRVAEIPFDSERKCMTTIHRWSGGFMAFTKGGVDVMLEKTVNVLKDQKLEPLDADEVSRVNDRMAANGLRVLGVAARLWNELPDDLSPEHVETGLTFLGLVGMMDPPREEVRRAVSLCKSAGIRPVMITGDHPLTALSIARRIGIVEDGCDVMTCRELDKMPMDVFEKRVEEQGVYARMIPEQKLKIVKALQDRGQCVAMTGDGVNDAPALKRADIGIAMGITGTDVSKEASHMILLDDNFATIVNAVQEGRMIYDNIRKFIKYLLACNAGEVLTLFLAPLLGLPLPLQPIQILWMNLVTDSLPALALAVEPAEGEVMKRPPRDPREGIFAHGLGVFCIWVGLLMAVLCIGVQYREIAAGNEDWETMVFTVIVWSQLTTALAVRSEKESLFRMGLLSNKAMLGAVALGVALQLAVTYVPFLNPVFDTKPLTAVELAFCAALSLVPLAAIEIEKFVKRKKG